MDQILNLPGIVLAAITGTFMFLSAYAVNWNKRKNTSPYQ
jgi:hypothetical protein